REAVGRGVAEEVEHLGVPEQRLAGDAAPVEAEAADALLLDEHDALAELRGADGRDITARPAADDGDVALRHGTPARGGSGLRGRRRCATASRRDTSCGRAGPPRRARSPARCPSGGTARTRRARSSARRAGGRASAAGTGRW